MQSSIHQLVRYAGIARRLENSYNFSRISNVSGQIDYAMNQALKTVVQDRVQRKELENNPAIQMTFSFTSTFYLVNGYLYTKEDKNWCQLERKTMFGILDIYDFLT